MIIKSILAATVAAGRAMIAAITPRDIGRLALTIIVAAGMLAGRPHGLFAMDFKVVGNQLILSGPVVGDELGKAQKILTSSQSIDTVVLRNSPGGNVPTGYRMGELFRARGLQTATSGHCYSSCSRMFLGGKRRYFTDDFPPEYTHVGFHGHYDNQGRLLSKDVRAFGLKNWIIKHSDGKADPALVDRWINIPVNVGMIHFYHPALVKRDGASTFMCQGTEPMARSVVGCEPIRKTALDLGIVTSLTILKSNDQSEVRTMLADRPKASGYAAIDDFGRLPITGGNGRQEYQRFLGAALPRAIALSPDGRHWAWNTGGFDAVAQALARCAQRSKQICKLYAVDNDVVWAPN